ncbi:MAG: hypothetical protein Q4B08_04545 [Propionibacteriaceae bacterium]|nr:hypothetical protein [Propionibacteriaceae bacterium]
MKAIRTQFDTGTFSGAVATPTCSSCCCCCCCAATMSSASVIGAVGSFRAAKRAGLSPAQRVLAIIAALVIPWLVLIAAIALSYPLLDVFELFLPSNIVMDWLPHVLIVTLTYASYFGLFSWVRVRSPWLRALAVTVVFVGIFEVELVRGRSFFMASNEGWWPYLRIAAVVAAGFVFLMLGLKGKRGRSGTDVVFGLPPKGAAAPPPGRPPGGPWPQS